MPYVYRTNINYAKPVKEEKEPEKTSREKAKELKKKLARAYYQRNRAKFADYSKKHYKKNKEEKKEYVGEHMKKKRGEMKWKTVKEKK